MHGYPCTGFWLQGQEQEQEQGQGQEQGQEQKQKQRRRFTCLHHQAVAPLLLLACQRRADTALTPQRFQQAHRHPKNADGK